MEAASKWSFSQGVSKALQDHLASQDSQAPQVPKASEEYQDSQELLENRDSRAFQETRVEKVSQGPQGSWDLEDPKVLQVSLAQMDPQAPLDFQGQLDPLGTEGFQEKC